MTEEQIASVVQDVEEAERGNGMAGVDRYAVLLNTKDVRRLLEERKRLLAAVKLGEYYAAVADGAGKAEPSEIQTIAAAISYAEEPAS